MFYDAWRDEMAHPMATEADAHREWHRNTGVPMGTPGCPQDACFGPDEWDGPDDYDDDGFRVEDDVLEHELWFGTPEKPIL